MEEKLLTPKEVKQEIANKVDENLKKEVGTALAGKNITDVLATSIQASQSLILNPS